MMHIIKGNKLLIYKSKNHKIEGKKYNKIWEFHKKEGN
jgi:hypothetical protein